MTRFLFLVAALKGPRHFSRVAFFYVLGILLILFSLIGGVPHVPRSPAHPLPSPYAEMPEPKPVPANAADELRKRINNRQY